MNPTILLLALLALVSALTHSVECNYCAGGAEIANYEVGKGTVATRTTNGSFFSWPPWIRALDAMQAKPSVYF